MIGNTLGLARDFIALKKSKQNAELATHNRVTAQQLAGTLSDTVLAAAQLYSFKRANLLREEAFWMVAIPIVLSTMFPDFAHNCVQNVLYAIPEKMLWLMGAMILAIFGLGKIKDFFRG